MAKRKDLNELAFHIVQQATHQVPKDREKDPAAVERGRLGGQARAEALEPERRLEIAKLARVARPRHTQSARQKAAKKALPR
jgi:hypothetical protein